MATLKFKFQAIALGDHYIGYNIINSGPVPFFDLEDYFDFRVITKTVTRVGDQSVDIPIPDNLYCAEFLAFGYVIAACQPQVDTNNDNVPDLAVTWSIPLEQQTDPILKWKIENTGGGASGSEIDQIILNADPGPCTDGVYQLQFNEVNPGDEIEAAVGTLTISGTSYVVDMTSQGLYTVAPTITVVGNDCFSVPDFTVTLLPPAPGATIGIDLRDYLPDAQEQIITVVNVLEEVPIYQLAPGEFIYILGGPDVETLLPDGLTATLYNNYHCEGCESVAVEAAGTTAVGATASKIGKMSFFTSWSNDNGFNSNSASSFNSLSLVTMAIKPGDELNTGCILKDSFILDKRNLDSEPTVTKNPCSQ